MKFISIYIKEGIYQKKIDFKDGVNLIFSKKNSRGKTTLLRILLYGLGYSIPNTKKMKFEKLDIKVELETEHLNKIVLNRINRFMIEVTVGSEKKTLILPNQQNELHKLIFNTSNIDILSNLLGSFYVDQEKGWTLLNRGKVIGENRFNIESLIRGLSEIDCDDLIKKENKLKNELAKYKQMQKVSEYRDSILLKSKSLVQEEREDEIDSELDMLVINERQLTKELRRIDATLSDNKKIEKYIADMNLIIEVKGVEVCVSEKNIVGLSDSIELLKAKRMYVSKQLKAVKNSILEIREEKMVSEKEYDQLSFFETVTQIEEFDKQVLQIPLNTKIIKKQIDTIIKEKSKIAEKIKKLTKDATTYLPYISNKIEEYGKELGLDDIKANYIFTNDLKVLSGAVLHKLVFAFRLGYILAIEDKLNIKLPIILDSPSGKEVDNDNISLMVNILKRDFSDNQIIVASIFEYDFDDVNKVEIFDRLLED
jgi:hypothetical protein|nr:MAG TPA: DNA REPAIR PROTEIN RECN [Caudoviricetes sp.]